MKNNMPPESKIYRGGLCGACGVAANVVTCLQRYGAPPKKLSFTVSTYGKGKCLVCKKIKPVTEQRDFFYPDLDLLKEVTDYLKNKKS